MRLYDGLPEPGPCEGCGFTTCRCKAELAERRAAARDEVVRAAQALDAAFAEHETPTDAWSLVAARKLAWDDHRAAVAALARLEGK